MLGGIRAKLSLFMCEGEAGQFHHGKTTNRIGSTVVSLSVMSLASLLTLLWVMHLNVGYNNNSILLCHGGRECVRKQLSYMSSLTYFAALLQTPYFYYSKVHVVGFLQHFELERPSNCEISRWVSRWSVFERRCSIRRSQRSSPWNGLFVWVTTGVKFSWRHLCVTLLLISMYGLKCSDRMKFQVAVKVPISSKFLFSYLILHITQ